MARKRGIGIAAASLCAIVIAGSAFAQGYGAPNAQGRQGRAQGAGMNRARICPVTTLMPPAPRMIQFMTSQLNLTQEQTDKLTQISQSYTKNTEKPQAAATKAIRDLTDALRTGCTDADKLNQLAAAGIKAEEPIAKAQAQFWADFNKTLTEDQRTQYWTAYTQMLRNMGRQGMGQGQGRSGAGGFGRRGGANSQDNSGAPSDSNTPAEPTPAPEQ